MDSKENFGRDEKLRKMAKTIERRVIVGYSNLAFSFDDGCDLKMIDQAIEFYSYVMDQKRHLLIKDKNGNIKNFVRAYKNYAFEIDVDKKRKGLFSPKTIFYGQIREKGPNGVNFITFSEVYNPNKSKKH